MPLCGVPMVHEDKTVSTCTLPKNHYIEIEDSDHYDVHGCCAPVLVHQSTIREVRQVQELRAKGYFND